MKNFLFVVFSSFILLLPAQQKGDYKLILSVLNKKNREPLKDISVEIINLENNHRDTLLTKEASYYTVFLHENTDYYIHTLPHYKKFPEAATFTSTKGKSKGLIFFKSLEIELPMQVAYSIKVENIYFEKNSYKLSDAAKFELDKLNSLMQNNPTFEVEFTSYCDCKENNTALVAYRNYAVFDFLRNNGLERKRMRVNNVMNGVPEQCKASGCTTENQQQYRKTEFKVLKF